MTRFAALLTVPTFFFALTAPVWAQDAKPAKPEEAQTEASAADSFLGSWVRDTAVQVGVGVGVGKLAEKAGSDLAPVVGVIPSAVSAVGQYRALSQAEAQAQAQAEAEARAQAEAQARARSQAQKVVGGASSLSSMMGLPF